VQDNRIGTENDPLLQTVSNPLGFLQGQADRCFSRSQALQPGSHPQITFYNLVRNSDLLKQRRPARRGRGKNQFHPNAPVSPAW
jgi:hypothetical protein